MKGDDRVGTDGADVDPVTVGLLGPAIPNPEPIPTPDPDPSSAPTTDLLARIRVGGVAIVPLPLGVYALSLSTLPLPLPLPFDELGAGLRDLNPYPESDLIDALEGVERIGGLSIGVEVRLGDAPPPTLGEGKVEGSTRARTRGVVMVEAAVTYV